MARVRPPTAQDAPPPVDLCGNGASRRGSGPRKVLSARVPPAHGDEPQEADTALETGLAGDAAAPRHGRLLQGAGVCLAPGAVAKEKPARLARHVRGGAAPGNDEPEAEPVAPGEALRLDSVDLYQGWRLSAPQSPGPPPAWPRHDRAGGRQRPSRPRCPVHTVRTRASRVVPSRSPVARSTTPPGHCRVPGSDHSPEGVRGIGCGPPGGARRRWKAAPRG